MTFRVAAAATPADESRRQLLRQHRRGPGLGNLAGAVTDAASAPVGGATVTLNHGLFDLGGATIGTVTTNSSGSFTLSNIPAGTWEVEVSLATRSAAKNVSTAPGGGTGTVSVTLP